MVTQQLSTAFSDRFRFENATTDIVSSDLQREWPETLVALSLSIQPEPSLLFSDPSKFLASGTESPVRGGRPQLSIRTLEEVGIIALPASQLSTNLNSNGG